ncbi:hypothetical protein GCM10027346_20790 [Hymenobacter seoulensis]
MTNRPDVKELKFNRPQLRFILAKLASAVSLWSRATGKSTLIAWLMHMIVQHMPRSAWGLVGSTYGQILTRTLPSTIDALEKLGYFKDVHYFIGRKPPPSWGWPEPFQRPVKYDNFIIFYTGTGFHLISQDGGSSSSRGLNLDGWIADEGLLLDREKLGTDVIASNRGNLGIWDCPLHHGKFIFSSMPWGDQGKWLLEDSAYYERDGVDFSQVRNQMIKLQVEFVDSRATSTRMALYQEILDLSAQLRFYANPKSMAAGKNKIPKGLLYSEANIFDNLLNIGVGYLEEQRRELSDFVFLIEILNQRPATVEAGFYPKLNIGHHAQECMANDYIAGLNFNIGRLRQPGCLMDSDCLPFVPLRGAVDWGSKISVMTIAQIHKDAGEYRFLKDFYVKHPKLIEDLAKLFCDYYEHHHLKEFHFIEDSEWGNARKPDSKLTYNQQFAECLRERGWRVRFFNQGRVPNYAIRYKLGIDLLGESDTRQLLIRFNKVNNKNTLTAMSMAPLKENSRGEIEKDKTSERKKTIPGEEATHFTDTVDLHFMSIDKHVVRSTPEAAGLLIVSS